MRTTSSCALALILLVTTASGCFLYLDDDDDCLYGGGDVPALEPLPGIRNPYSGQCEFHGGGGGGTCNPACGPCEPTPADPAPGGALPSWGFCESYCSGLDQLTCLATPGCRGAYLDSGVYFECWAVDMTGPIQGGGCEGLDAWSCSVHDDCIAVHASTCPIADPSGGGDIACGAGQFVACAAEPGGTDPGTCFGDVFCESEPPGCPPNSIPGRRNGCWTGACILVEQCEPMPVSCEAIADEETCIARPECEPLYEGSDCTCTPDGQCECTTWEFTGCAPASPRSP